MSSSRPSVSSLTRRLVQSSLTRGVGVVLGSRVAGAALGLGTQVLLARWLGVSEYGTYGVILAWASLLTVGFSFGAPGTLMRFIAEYRETNDAPRLRGLLTYSRRFFVGVSVVLVVLGGALLLASGSDVLGSDVLGSDVLGTDLTRWRGVALALCITPALLWVHLQQHACRATGMMGTAYALPLIGRPLLFLGLVAGCLAFFSHSLTGWEAVLLYASASVPVGAAQTWRFRRRIGRHFSKSAPDRASPHTSDTQEAPIFESSTWMRVAWPLFLASGFVMLLSKIDLLVVGWWMNAADAGVYTAAVTLAAPVGFVFAAVNAVVVPRFASLHAGDDRDALRRLLRVASHLAFWPTLGAGLVVVLARPLLLNLFGAGFEDAGPVLIVLVLSHVANTSAGAVGALLNMTGHHRDSAWIYGGSTLLALVATPLLVSAFGLLGAAASTLGVTVLWNAWLHARVRHRLNLRPSIFATLSSR